MTRGKSLEQDLRSLINNPKYSDIVILCEDEKKLYGCRTILAARSEVFDRLLYNGMKESFEKQISFPTFNSPEMEIILEYIYTGSIKNESLTKNNMIEAFYAADYFQLPDLQNLIVKIIKTTDYIKNYSPELLSKVVEIMPLVDDNILLNYLVEAVAVMPLNTIEFGRLSITGLWYLLYYTYEKEKPFVSPEYEVFWYSAILAANQVSSDAYKTLMKQLPTLKQLEDSIQIENKFITDHQEVVKELDPLVEFIDFRRIKTQILDDIIKPLEIIPDELILNVYDQYESLSKNLDLLRDTRGIPHYIWDELSCGSKLTIKDDKKVVCALDNRSSHQNVRANVILEKGIFEWDIIIEKYCAYTWVGMCALENFNYEYFAGTQSTGWVLGSSGYCRNYNKCIKYCPSFHENSKDNDITITVHLDMNKRSCAFTVNGIKYPEVSGWNNLPSKLYPVVSLRYPGCFRIRPHYRDFLEVHFGTTID